MPDPAPDTVHHNPADLAPMRAGGRATEAGMAFQADVGTWIAAHILARLPVGGRFGMNNSALPTTIRLETGTGLDDIEVSQSDAGAIHIQCKTSATLSTGEKAPLTKTVGQLAGFVADSKNGVGLPDLTTTVAVLAVRSDAPATLDRLESGLRAFGLGGTWSTTVPQRNKAEQAALTAFSTIAVPAWTTNRGSPPVDADLVDMARIFRVARFAMDEGDTDWREASHVLGRRVFGDEAAGDAPLRDLRAIIRDLIANGASADRPGLLRALRLRGHVDIASPDFAADIASLNAATQSELERLALHTRLPIGGGVALARVSDAPMDSAIATGSLLIVGEPGAGKTGALVAAASRRIAAGDAVLFLSVDRFPGVAINAHLQSELGLAHPLFDVLAAYPGSGRKILFIDALDAARGGPAEAVFASVIEAVRTHLDDWNVIASIRTFDLRNGRRYRAAMIGMPPDMDFAEPGLANVRHFLVPRLGDADLARLSSTSVPLAALFGAAPSALHALLHNIFNLSLATQLLADGASASSFGAIRSQSGLIDAYEDERLATTPLQQAASATVNEMATRGRLAVRKVLVQHGALDDVIQAGVLAEAGDLVSFTHHVLFDHVAGRFYLEWDDSSRLIAQISGDASRALLLAPALRFAIERLWRSDQPGKLRARSLIDDDGGIHPRIRLVRPLEATNILAEVFATGHWEPVDRERFSEVWQAELADLPEFETSTLHMVSGLLLPIWRRLPNESTRVYRLQTDAGERVIGRKVSPAWVATVIEQDTASVVPADAWAMLCAGDAKLHLAEDQTLARVRAMNDWRIELTGFNDLGIERLKAMGLISEIVSWKLKLYIPTGAVGLDVLAKLLDRFPIQRVAARKAA